MNNNAGSSSSYRSCTFSNLCSWFLSLRLTRSKKSIVVALVALLSVVYTGHRTVSYKLNNTEWFKAPINDMYRECPAPQYPTLTLGSTGAGGSAGTGGGSAGAAGAAATAGSKQDAGGKICMTTLTDAKAGSPLQRFVRWRNFDSLLEMTWPNKQAYADKHGYYLFNESDTLDKSRPPSWSKIKAAQRLLNEENCDWVFWLDADTVVMNSEKTVQAFLPLDKDKDLILTRQKGGSYNAGAWLIRNSAWSKQFLQHWWDMKEFVQPPGLSTSGDNDALKAYLLDQMDPTEFKKHIVAPPRCQFNSVTIFLSPAEHAVLVKDPALIPQQEYYMNREKYHKGDLIAHVAGKNNKIDTTALLLKDAV
jgi:mannan polymerase II complex MNN10 subunit